MKDVYDNYLPQIKSAMILVIFIAYGTSCIHFFMDTLDNVQTEFIHQAVSIGTMLVFFLILVSYIQSTIKIVIPSMIFKTIYALANIN